MLKNIVVAILYFLSLIFFSVNSVALYGESCVVSLNSSSGDFYNANHYSIKDEFIGNGKSKTYPPTYDYENLIINYYDAKIVKTSNQNSYAKNYYCYSSALPNAVIVNGEKVNVQIAVTEFGVTVGYPIIYYAY